MRQRSHFPIGSFFHSHMEMYTHTRTHAHIHIHTVRTEHRAQPFCSYMTAVTLLRTALAPVAAGAKPMRLLPTSNTV